MQQDLILIYASYNEEDEVWDVFVEYDVILEDYYLAFAARKVSG